MENNINDSGIEIVVESGADMPEELAQEYGIHVIPMHVTFGDTSLDDGKFPVKKVFDYYDESGILPQTSATNPDEYERLFKHIHEENPNSQILHLCYSAVTTATWQNAIIGSEDMDYVTHIDTQFVSIGQSVVALRTAEYIRSNKGVTIEELKPVIEGIINTTRMCFIPDTLLYLKAGGRVSNAAFLGASILSLHPVIAIKKGKLISCEKLRGSIEKVGKKVLSQATKLHKLSRERIYFIYEKENFKPEAMEKLEQAARELGYKEIKWMRTGCVISTHGGPGAFGIVGCQE